MTAIEANAIAKNHNQEIMDHTLNYIEEAIRKNAMNGKFNVSISLKDESNIIVYTITNYLRNLGYKVDFQSSTQRDPAELCISWEDEDETNN